MPDIQATVVCNNSNIQREPGEAAGIGVTTESDEHLQILVSWRVTVIQIAASAVLNAAAAALADARVEA